MRKTITILLATVLLVSLFVSCNNEEIVDNALTCIITFDRNGADSEEQVYQRAGKGVGIDLSCNTIVKDGFDLLWWTTEADGSGTVYRNGQHVCLEADLMLYAQWGHFLSEETTAWTDGQVYYFDRDISFAEQITVSGNVTLILPDGYTLTAAKGITVNEGNDLTIDVIGNGTGAVNAFAMDPNPDESKINHNAAIGSEENCSSGLITINGGTVNATSESFGAAIGGGKNSNGTVTINGGYVNATSGTYGAAVGGGRDGNGTVTINGGTVNTTSGTYGAAIGGGLDRSGTVTINGGTVNATGGKLGAGIGGGFNGSCGSVVINDGTVNASSGLNGAAIGYGYTGPGGGTVVINGGTVTATAGKNGAGIGGCYDGPGVNVTINGGQVLAIGGGYDGTTGIGRGSGGANDGTLTLGEGVSILVSSDNVEWTAYDGTRQKYMKTE